MDQLLKRLQKDYANISFEISDNFCWSPSRRIIYYTDNSSVGENSSWALLHELAHAILDHNNYSSDIELLLKEVEAWEEAKKLAQRYGLNIDEDHIQDCLDTYRDWLHRRSKCPKCKINTTQDNHEQYKCFNCQTTWRVSSSRFCRPYRLTKRTQTKKSAGAKLKTTFT